MLVSVILPSYNVAKYIYKTVASVQNQTHKDLEILCVDAGSTDGTREIIEQLAMEDKRIKLITSDIKSYGYQVNLGISLSKGEYIGIVETDDYIAADTYSDLTAIAEKTGCDIIKGVYDIFYETEEKELRLRISLFPDNMELYDHILNPRLCPRLLLYDSYLWTGIYKKSFLQKFNIRLNETPGAAYQDNGFLHQTICQAEKVYFVNKSYYRYRRDNESSSTYSANGLCMMLNEYYYIWNFYNNNKDQLYVFAGAIWDKMIRLFRWKLRTYFQYNRNMDDLHHIADKWEEIFSDGIKNNAINMYSVGYNEWRDLNMFLDNRQAFFDRLYFEEEFLYKAYQEFLRKVKSLPNIIIVSCGDVGRNLSSLLLANGVKNIIGFCDNDESKWGKKFNGIPINQFAKYDNTYYIIASSNYYSQLYTQLLGLNIEDDNIVPFRLYNYPQLVLSKKYCRLEEDF